MALVMVMYSYLGIEIIGVTAGEAKDPQVTIKNPSMRYSGVS